MMDSYKIVGGARLAGSIDIRGSKNTALAVMSGVLLAHGVTTLRNVPDLSDTRAKAKLLRQFGATVDWEGDILTIDCSTLRADSADEATVRSIRTSFYMLGPLLARTGHVELPSPGGCKIGARPVDFHLKGLEKLGATISLDGGVYHARADRLKGAEIYLDFPSAGATQHLMTTAALAEGITVIDNAAMEPEVTSLGYFLNALGARVEGAGTSKITIQGVPRLNGAEFFIPADRMQAGTYLLGAAITQGDITVQGVLPEHQTALLKKLSEAGATVTEGHDWVRVQVTDRLSAIKVMTMPHPGFPTDMQQPMSAVLAVADGTSLVEETIYENRIGHIQELNRMGAHIRVEGRTAVIAGVKRLQGTSVEASDLRAGAALVLAGLAADGVTVVNRIDHIARGYQNFCENLASLGASISRVPAKSGAEETI